MPGQMLRACSRCGRPFQPRHGRHYHCEDHEQRGNQHRSPTTRTRPSSSAARERIRAEVLARDPYCTIRLAGCTGTSTVADHILPAADGGRYEPANLRGACDHCNSVRGGGQTSRPEIRPRDDRDGPPFSRGEAARSGRPGTRLA